MTKQLTTQNATITTASVEVQTLTISGKQVTLAVFRQLREEPLIADDGALNGVPWGIVNYHPEKCTGSVFPHWHIVWQRGTELLRARVNHVAPFDEGGQDQDGRWRYRPLLYASETANKLLEAAVLEWLVGRREKCPLRVTGHKWIGGEWYSDSSEHRSGHGFTVVAQASRVAVEAANARASLHLAEQRLTGAQEELDRNTKAGARTWSGDFGQTLLEEAQSQVEKCRAADASARDELADRVTARGIRHAQVLEEHNAQVRAEADLRQRHRDALAALAELPQLFIAV